MMMTNTFITGWAQTWKTWSTRGFLWTWKLRHFSWNSVQPWGKFFTNITASVRSDICITQQGLWLQMNKVSWITEMVTVHWWPATLLELMWNGPWHIKVIITFTFCCNSLWKSGSGKAWKTPAIFFVLCCHPVLPKAGYFVRQHSCS